MFSPSVEEGRKPRRRPRGRSVGKNPLDPARGRTIKPTRGVRHPGGVVYLLCIFVSRGRRSYASPTPGLKDDDPSGATPLRDRTARHFDSLLFITNNDAFVLLIVLLLLFPFLGKRHTDMVFLLILDILVTSRHALATDRLGKIAFLPRKKAIVA